MHDRGSGIIPRTRYARDPWAVTSFLLGILGGGLKVYFSDLQRLFSLKVFEDPESTLLDHPLEFQAEMNLLLVPLGLLHSVLQGFAQMRAK